MFEYQLLGCEYQIMNEPVNQSIWVSLGRHIGGKVLTALLLLAVCLTGYWFYQNPEQLQSIWQVVKYTLIWIGFVAVLPWALFFLPQMILRFENNLAGVGLLICYAILDVLMAWWLADWDFEGGALTWSVRMIGFLVASLYNFLVADYLASRADAGP
ncbi:MAG: hypothetical protein HJJLKODD_00346 [Phycisphaerae bacterium]|nr:hypothetical protein [Phycisphaerae bacterium]